MASAEVLERQTYSVREVASLLGISSSLAYELARKDGLPVPVLRIGENRMVVPSAAVDELLARRKERDDAAA